MSDSDDDDHDYLLWCAVRKNKPEEVKRLIELGGNVNYEERVRGAYWPTPLLHALGNSWSPSCARILIEAKVDLENLRKTNGGGETALMVAAKQGDSTMVKLLLENGAASTKSIKSHARPKYDHAGDVICAEDGKTVLEESTTSEIKALLRDPRCVPIPVALLIAMRGSAGAHAWRFHTGGTRWRLTWRRQKGRRRGPPRRRRRRSCGADARRWGCYRRSGKPTCSPTTRY